MDRIMWLILLDRNALQSRIPDEIMTNQWLVDQGVNIKYAYVLFTTQSNEWEIYLVKIRHDHSKVIEILWLWILEHANRFPVMYDIIVWRVPRDEHLVLCKFNKIIWRLILEKHRFFLLIVEF